MQDLVLSVLSARLAAASCLLDKFAGGGEQLSVPRRAFALALSLPGSPLKGRGQGLAADPVIEAGTRGPQTCLWGQTLSKGWADF